MDGKIFPVRIDDILVYRIRDPDIPNYGIEQLEKETDRKREQIIYGGIYKYGFFRKVGEGC